jgi:hypothetical protein
MGTALSQPDERQQLERQLIKEMQTAEQAYRSATAEHTNVRNERGNMLDYLDGSSDAVHKAAKNERVTLENYTRALNVVNDLILHGRHSAV